MEQFEFLLDVLLQLKCTYEKGNDNLYAIDVPLEVDINEVYKVLEIGEQRGVWDFEEGHCSAAHLKS